MVERALLRDIALRFEIALQSNRGNAIEAAGPPPYSVGERTERPGVSCILRDGATRKRPVPPVQSRCHGVSGSSNRSETDSLAVELAGNKGTQRRPRNLICIGGSAGALSTLKLLLPRLPTYAVPVVIALHIPERGDTQLREALSGARQKCCEPFDKQSLSPGTWIAPAGYHLLIEEERTFALSIEPPVNFSRPSIDALFESAAHASGGNAICVILSGSGADGAMGALAIREAGGTVFVHSPQHAEYPSMPSAAIRLAAPDLVADVQTIAAAIDQLVGVQ
jgi:two-component system, chemotaxis family, protein-glutamate methylesterase/glutaminase